MVNSRYFTFALVLGAVLAAGVGIAETRVYRCVDEHGQASFQDFPCRVEHAVAPPAPAPAGWYDAEKHFFWKVSATAGTAYLLGSIHFGVPEMYPMPPVITEAFHGADALVVEVNLAETSPSELFRVMASKGTYSDGSTLKAQVEPQTWQRLEQLGARYGIPSIALEHGKPWMVSSTLVAAALQRTGFVPELGVDVHFMGQAKGSKPIIELESLAEQVALLDGLPMPVQTAMLVQALDELERGEDFFARMVDAWRTGDANTLDGLLNDGFRDVAGGEALVRVLLTDRNTAMARRIDELMAGGGDYFVVVGAGHLTGAQGIIAQLRARGYAVEQL